MSKAKHIARILTGYPSKTMQNTDLQCKTIVFIAYIAAPTAAIFAVINYFSDHLWLAAVEVFIVFLLLPCFKLISHQDALPWVRNVLMCNAVMMFTSAFIDGGVAHSGIIWSLIVPFFAFLLMGLPLAWYWVISYALLNTFVIIMHFTGHLSLPYDSVLLAYFPAVFLFFALVAAVFEVQLERLHRNHEETIDELKALRKGLESRIKNKTKALTLSNTKLQQEVEEHKQTANALIKSEALFLQAQKMEAVGTLVGGIAHDFNNMLAGITSNLYLAKQYAKDSPEAIERLDRIDSISFRASDMIKQLLTFARKDKVDMQQLAFTPFINETVKFIRPSVPENIQIQTRVCTESLYIHGDRTQLHQVLMNLINNARDSLESIDAPKIIVQLEAFYPDKAFTEHHPAFTHNLYAHLSVEDNGCGIAEEHIKRLFEPFYTSKEQGKGTGLGLAMLFGAIKTHHGSVGVKSVVGKGSTFSIYLPAIDAQNKAVVSISALEVIHGHGEMVLLVDDDMAIIETGKEVLETLGYRVQQADNGQHAVDLYSKHGNAIDLIIMDVIMPVMGGDKAAQHIRELNPAVKIIFSTGYDHNSQHSMRGETVLNKPFSIIDMSHAIDQQLQP